MVSVTERVLMEPALAVKILSHLCQRDLLLSQRVCSAWHGIINTSPTLLKQLFLHPGPLHKIDHSERVEHNPLLMLHFPSFYGHDLSPEGYKRFGLGPWHDALCVGFSDDRPAKRARPGRGAKGYVHDTLPSIDQQLLELYMRPEASWKRMLLCHPAPMELQVSYRDHKEKPGREVLKGLDFSNTGRPGPPTQLRQPWLTFGLLYSIVEAAWFHNATFKAHHMCFEFNMGDDSYWDMWRCDRGDSIIDLTRTRSYFRGCATPRAVGGNGRLVMMFVAEHYSKDMTERPYAGSFAIVNSVRWSKKLVWDSHVETAITY